MKVGSLFSGIGGLDLGLERAGMTVAWQSEVDPYCCRVLAKHWPHVPNLGDITTTDWSTVEPVDVICGGYPCQPFSLAGVRRGEDDARHLWPHFADALRVLRPRFALLENVPGHLSLGFGRVLGDLAELGFDAEWDCIPAAAVGAPHLRYRVFVVADSGGARRRQDAGSTLGYEATDEGRAAQHDHVTSGDGESGRAQSLADTASIRRERVAYVAAGYVDYRPHAGRAQETGRATGDGATRGVGTVADAHDGGCNGRPRLVWSSGRGQPADGGQWATEPDVGRVAHGVPARVDRLRALGNAVVPQVAEWVGHRIMEVAA